MSFYHTRFLILLQSFAHFTPTPQRWDGRGYPDGLKGNDIPISAQIVSLADVYDALTSERCYKKAFSHETAMRMILNGECGAFNPLLLECLTDIQAELQEKSQNIAVKH